MKSRLLAAGQCNDYFIDSRRSEERECGEMSFFALQPLASSACNKINNRCGVL